MRPIVSAARAVPARADLVAIGLTESDVSAAALKRAGLPAKVLSAQGFTGRADQTSLVADDRGRTVLVVGLGARDRLDDARLRRASAQAVRAAQKVTSLAITFLDSVPPAKHAESARAIAEGAMLGSYRFVALKSDAKPAALARVTITGSAAKPVADAVRVGAAIGAAQNLARDLVNRPGGELTPARLADEARAIAKRERLTIKVLGPAQMKRMGLGGLLGVSRGSTQEPRFVEIAYSPARARGTLAFVGKGLTFDSGGLSIKTGEGMMTMKMDMGGAAAVLGFFSAVRAVKPTCRVVCYLPMTANMSDGDATRPGDVLTIRNGRTVEVLNTDAEGRLVLADALSLATEAKPDAIVDLATLTGAVEIALGSRIAAVLGNDDAFVDQVRDAAERAGERVWPLPMPADYRPMLDSDVADLRNISKGRGAGTITAAIFLEQFVGEGIPWAHLDIAGTAWWAEGADGEFSNGGTGFGVRTLLELARTFTPPARRRTSRR